MLSSSLITLFSFKPHHPETLLDVAGNDEGSILSPRLKIILADLYRFRLLRLLVYYHFWVSLVLKRQILILPLP